MKQFILGKLKQMPKGMDLESSLVGLIQSQCTQGDSQTSDWCIEIFLFQLINSVSTCPTFLLPPLTSWNPYRTARRSPVAAMPSCSSDSNHPGLSLCSPGGSNQIHSPGRPQDPTEPDHDLASRSIFHSSLYRIPRTRCALSQHQISALPPSLVCLLKPSLSPKALPTCCHLKEVLPDFSKRHFLLTVTFMSLYVYMYIFVYILF